LYLTKDLFYGDLVFLQDYIFVFIIKALGSNSQSLNSLWPASVNEFDIATQNPQWRTPPLNVPELQ